MNELIELMKSQNDKIYEIIEKANNILNIKNDEKYIEFIGNKGWYLWNRIKDISFSEYVKSIEYQKEYFPYSTQHSVKGSEFDNVLVILDNGKWNMYNFNLLLENIFDENNRKKEVRNFKEIKFVLSDRMEAGYKKLGNRFLNKKNFVKIVFNMEKYRNKYTFSEIYIPPELEKKILENSYMYESQNICSLVDVLLGFKL